MNSIYALHNYVKYMGLVSLSNICILATSCFYFESFFFFFIMFWVSFASCPPICWNLH